VHRRIAVLGSAVSLAAPSTLDGLVPFLLTGWRMRTALPVWLPVRLVGIPLMAAGCAVVLASYVRFALEGLGTPAPMAPPDQLVDGGLYRYVRNPIYLAMVAIIAGQALLLWQPVLVGYAVLMVAVTVTVVRWYEQPALHRRFGDQYDAYRRAVPGWWPRWRPWRGAGTQLSTQDSEA
jgi:protein-S-isoprenylcysteine O-methyltransferase Ste14